MYHLVSVADPYFAVHLNFIYNTPTSSSQAAGGPSLTDAEIAGRKMVTHVEGTRLSDFSALVDVIRGNIAWLIFQTVLPINTSVGDFPLSLRWTRVMHVIRNRLIDPSVSTSPFVFSKARFNVSTNFSA